MKRRFPSKRRQAPRYPTLQDGRRLLLAGILGLSGCGVTAPYDDPDNTTVVANRADAGHRHTAPDADDFDMGVAPFPGLDAGVPDTGEMMMGEAPEPGLDASVPEQPGPDAGDLFMGDIAMPEVDAGPPPGPDASDMMMGGMALPDEDAGY